MQILTGKSLQSVDDVLNSRKSVAFITEELRNPAAFLALVSDPVALAGRGFDLAPIGADGNLVIGSLFQASREPDEVRKLFDCKWNDIAIVDFRTEGEADVGLTVPVKNLKGDFGPFFSSMLAADIDAYLSAAPPKPLTDMEAIRECQTEILTRLEAWVQFYIGRAEARGIREGKTYDALIEAGGSVGLLFDAINSDVSDDDIDDRVDWLADDWLTAKVCADFETGLDEGSDGPRSLMCMELEESDIGSLKMQFAAIEWDRRAARDGCMSTTKARTAALEKLAFRCPGMPPEFAR